MTYPRPSLAAFASRMRRRGHPLPFVAVMCGIYTAVRLGFAARVADGLRRLLGRPPRGMGTFVADHADEFRPEGRRATDGGHPLHSRSR